MEYYPTNKEISLTAAENSALRQLERVKGKLTKDVQQAAAAEPKTTTKEKDTVNVEESGEEENPADSRQCRELARASEEDSEAAKDDSRAAGVSKPILSNLGVFQHNEESRASGVSRTDPEHPGVLLSDADHQLRPDHGPLF